MKKIKISAIILAAMVLISVTGCVSQGQYDGMVDKNRLQQDKLTQLENQLSNCEIQLKQVMKQLQTATGRDSAAQQAINAEIAALEADIASKAELIKKMQVRLLQSGGVLPMELNILLQEFAASNDMVTFDEDSGILKFKSDFLFGPGSDKVSANAVGSVEALVAIMNTDKAEKFDVIIAGFTDSDPIKASKARHPTNWHLSVHRGIGVLNLMINKGMSEGRLSVRGFGQFRPIADNATKEGKAANRRVEIYVVPKGV
jgi:chemotaxis protein MotB